VFVPAKRLPILDPLYILGLTGLADALDAPLRAAIEKGYDRSYLPAQPGWPPEAESEAKTESGPEGLSTEPERAATAVRVAHSQSAIVQEQNGIANPLADNPDSRLESEWGSIDAVVVDVDVDVDVDVVDVEVADVDVNVDVTAHHDALEGNAPEGNVPEENALDARVDEDQGAAAAQDSDSPERSSGEAAAPSDSDSSSDSDTSSGSQSPPGDESSPDGDE
ncbi:MAG: PE-PPE domain-containing protein, partial [Actinomycetia bacterium]|nr:PE-PPE domain-containing protein [Actinomycetes bacterium]